MVRKVFCPTCKDNHPRKIPFEFSKINDYIYIGTNACCKDVFEKSLVNKGIKSDLSLEEKHLDSPRGVEMFLWIPTKNYRVPKKHQVSAAINFIDNCINHKKKVYVHCERGHTRAPTIVIAYLISRGISFKKAFETVKKKRPVIHLSKYQLEFLKKMERQHRKNQKYL